MFFGVIDKFPSIIKNSITIGMHNNKVVPVLSTHSYVQDDQWNPNNPTVIKNGQGSDGNRYEPLMEIVEGVFYIEEDIEVLPPYERKGMTADIYPCLVTRQIGSSDPSRWEEYTRISVIYEKNGEVHVWSPLIEEILDSVEQMSEYGIRWIQRLLEYNEDRGLHVLHNKENILHSDFLVKRKCFKDKIPKVVIEEVIRNVFISEDKVFKYNHQKGKYLTFLAIVDYIEKGHSMEEIIKNTKMKRKIHPEFLRKPGVKS